MDVMCIVVVRVVGAALHELDQAVRLQRVARGAVEAQRRQAERLGERAHVRLVRALGVLVAHVLLAQRPCGPVRHRVRERGVQLEGPEAERKGHRRGRVRVRADLCQGLVESAGGDERVSWCVRKGSGGKGAGGEEYLVLAIYVLRPRCSQ